MASHLTTIVETAKSRLLAQYRKLTLRFVPLIEGLAAEVQELEDGAWGLFIGLTLDAAVGDMLDRYGYILQEPREGFTADAAYRNFLKAKVIANGSRGRIEDFNAAVAQALALDSPEIIVHEVPPLAIEVTINAVAIVQPRRERLRRLVSKVRGATVRVQLLTTTTGDETQDFSFDGGPGPGFAGVSPTVAGGKFRSAVAAPK